MFIYEYKFRLLRVLPFKFHELSNLMIYIVFFKLCTDSMGGHFTIGGHFSEGQGNIQHQYYMYEVDKIHIHVPCS